MLADVVTYTINRNLYNLLFQLSFLVCGLPCQNGGTQRSDCSVCDCRDGFTGSNCETDIDECLSSPCVNGYCLNLCGSFNCVCDSGFIGELCNVRDPVNSASAQTVGHGLSYGVIASKWNVAFWKTPKWLCKRIFSMWKKSHECVVLFVIWLLFLVCSHCTFHLNTHLECLLADLTSTWLIIAHPGPPATGTGHGEVA